MRPEPGSTALREQRRVISLLDADAGLADGLDDCQLQEARKRVLTELVSCGHGPWAVDPQDFEPRGGMGLLVVNGVLIRKVTVGDYTCAELLGPGDVLQPWLRVGPEESVATEIGWKVAEETDLAVLGRDFLLRAAPWPEIAAAVSRRLMQRTHWLAFHLAVCGLRRVDDRLLTVLWHFADRWGKVTPDGVRVELRLTHDVLAAVIGARRPSASTALKRLSDQGRLRPLKGSRWLLLGPPPPELQQVHHRVRRPPANDTWRLDAVAL